MAERLEVENDLKDALHNTFAEFSRFGKTELGGVSRLAASVADGQARDYLCDWLKKNGLDITVDAVGNIFGTLDLECGDPDQHFFCGSHLDSQPNGGRFDGALGVVCACIAALLIKERVKAGKISPTCGRIVVACWTSEEGARFQPSLLGSGVFTGKLSEATALSITDKDNIALSQALSKIGYLGTGVAPRPERYLEIHIEQGRRLEDTGTAIGIVTSCWGARKLRVETRGRPDHTGPAPMDERKDALCCAAHVVLATNRIAKTAQVPVHSSVGRMEIEPNSPNTVAERVQLWTEFRCSDEDELERVESQFIETLSQKGRETGCEVNVLSTEKRAVVEFDETAVDLAEAALDNAKISHMRLTTIAGHDAVSLQAICPATLLFVPSKNGVSHTPEEFTSAEDFAVGFDAVVCVISDLISLPSDAPALKAHHV